MILFGLLLAAKAELHLVEPFLYHDGPVTTGIGSPWVSASGTPGTAMVSQHQLQLEDSRSEDVRVPLNASFVTNASEIYFSFSLQSLGLPTDAGGHFASLLKGNTAIARLSLSGGNAASNSFRLSLAAGSGASLVESELPQDIAITQSVRLVLKLERGSGLLKLWLHGPDETLHEIQIALDPAAVPKFLGFRQTSGIGSLRISNLLIGTELSDVVQSVPHISSITNIEISSGEVIPPVPLKLDGTLETEAGAWIVVAANPALFPSENLSVEILGTGRMLRLIPAATIQGSSEIQVRFWNGRLQVQRSFLVTVGRPTISVLPDLIARSGQPIVVEGISVSDDSTSAPMLTVTADGSNTNLILPGAIHIERNGNSRKLKINLPTGISGSSWINVQVSDGFSTASSGFFLTVYQPMGRLLSENYKIQPSGPLDSNVWEHTAGTTGQVQITNGSLMLSQKKSEDVRVALTNRFPAGTSNFMLWASISLEIQQVPTGAGNYFAHFRDRSGNHRARLFVTTNGVSKGKFRFGISNGASQPSTLSKSELDLNTLQSLVLEYNPMLRQTRFWNVKNPAEVLVATDPVSSGFVADFVWRQNSGIGVVSVQSLEISGEMPLTISSTDRAPELRIRPVNGKLELHWEAVGDSWVLEWSNNLNFWNQVPGDPAVVGNLHQLLLDPNDDHAFFRLAQKSTR